MSDRIKIQRQKQLNNNYSYPQLATDTSRVGMDTTHGSANHDISRISLRPQARLTVSQPGDSYEREADKVAQQVMGMSDRTLQREVIPQAEEENLQLKSLANPITPLVQREEEKEEEENLQMKPVGNFAIQREELAEEEPEEIVQAKSSLQRVNDGGLAASNDIASKLHSRRGEGNPLADDVRSFMEPRFRVDFSHVKVHTDGEAVQMTKDVGAQAFTYGSDVYFGAGKLPGNNELTAHELTHVVQQNTQLGRIHNPDVPRPHHTISPSIMKIQRFGGGGHEKATEKGLQGMFTAEQMKEIQFGNWKTDMNQISLVIPFLEKVGITLTKIDCAKIIQILATDKFGKKIGDTLTASSLGTYKEAEHFDNPGKTKKDADIAESITDGRTLIKKKLQKVVSSGNTPLGRETLGETIHAIQDIYAHSNFVEIALKESGKPIDTMGGVTSSGEPIMTSGTFAGLDTAISIAKIIADKLKEPAKTGKKLSTGTRIAMIILDRNGYGHVSAAYLKALAMIEKSKKAFLSMLPKKLRQMAEAVIRPVEALLQKAKEWAFNKLGNTINYITQIASRFTGNGDHPSHSKLAKDSDSEKRGLYPLALKLATVATQAFGNQIKLIWDLQAKNARLIEDLKAKKAGQNQINKAKKAGQNQINSEQKELNKMVEKYMGHPKDDNWWKRYIKQ